MLGEVRQIAFIFHFENIVFSSAHVEHLAVFRPALNSHARLSVEILKLIYISCLILH